MPSQVMSERSLAAGAANESEGEASSTAVHSAAEVTASPAGRV